MTTIRAEPPRPSCTLESSGKHCAPWHPAICATERRLPWHSLTQPTREVRSEDVPRESGDDNADLDLVFRCYNQPPQARSPPGIPTGVRLKTARERRTWQKRIPTSRGMQDVQGDSSQKTFLTDRDKTGRCASRKRLLSVDRGRARPAPTCRECVPGRARTIFTE